MNQRISVRALVSRDDKTLLLKRLTGRESILGLFEIPGGRVDYGEQPEDALRRYLHDDVGLHIDKSTLFDVVTYIDHDDRDIQYAVIVFQASIAGGHHDLKLSENYSESVWQSIDEVQSSSVTDLTQLILGIMHQEDITDKSIKSIKKEHVDTGLADVVIFADGGSRGNPGPSASGFVIMDSENNVLARGGEYLGITTNNQAEYHGVRLGLEKALEMGLKSVDFRLDSMLVVNQMNGVYTIKNRDLWPINERIRDLMSKFDHVSYHHVPRDMNQLADGEVNRNLDAHDKDTK